MYHDIADDLIRSIQHHFFQDKLPTEQQLMHRYNVSRNTIRKAVDIVCQKGLARRVQGSGYYINDINQDEKHVVNLTMGLSTRISSQRLKSKVITFDRITADEALARQFGAKPGDELHRIIRSRYLDNKLYCLEYSYYEKSEVPFIPIDAAHESLLTFINEEYGITVNNTDQYLSTEPLSEEQSSILNLPTGETHIVLNQSLYRKNNTLFNFSYTVFLYKDLSFYFHSINLGN